MISSRCHAPPPHHRCCCGYLGSTRRDKEGLLVAHVSEVQWMVEARGDGGIEWARQRKLVQHKAHKASSTMSAKKCKTGLFLQKDLQWDGSYY
ncbi:Valine--tRNA ligase [Gossypium arboreum]|uniref:Valine--tRNA ligase n=1 Tax=Gossypium arboreum TaxID=29729 RepID=A0A0B0PG59_GOSAR|nr:Valine--tRNA ligase [Gossypium arboreum]